MKLYQNRILSQDKKYAIDVRHLVSKKLKAPIRRSGILKNVVLRIINERRQENKKPKLSDLLKNFSKSNMNRNEKLDLII